MKIIVIGAAGTIGTAVVEELGRRHDIVAVGKSRGQYQADMTDYAQVQALFGKVGKADAVVVAAGIMALEPLAGMTPERFRVGLNSKLMGQVHVALAAQHALNDGGSITLTSGIDVYHPIRHAANAVTSNAAVEGFVRGAAIELARGIRINAVTPGLLTESKEAYGHLFPGFETVPARRVALAYARSVEGAQTGQIYKVW
ncbi:short chain dehydrogenase [Duganella sp. FT92W]|uniref:Short chain dehydrogenase n=1 Tax=Pseudoduganella rivuli TaxID=2666085 RepID=A0A7X2LSU7_9BURK|nr:short chain dehydrogenase [Pseudoduganella rivuli]MRV71297.1 short chain dehydrogenase [Pseudoduganella rivuli]